MLEVGKLRRALCVCVHVCVCTYYGSTRHQRGNGGSGSSPKTHTAGLPILHCSYHMITTLSYMYIKRFECFKFELPSNRSHEKMNCEIIHTHADVYYLYKREGEAKDVWLNTPFPPLLTYIMFSVTCLSTLTTSRPLRSLESRDMRLQWIKYLKEGKLCESGKINT